MYTYGFVHLGVISGRGFAARTKRKVGADQSGGCRSTTLSMKIEVAATSADLKLLSDTNVQTAMRDMSGHREYS